MPPLKQGNRVYRNNKDGATLLNSNFIRNSRYTNGMKSTKWLWKENYQMVMEKSASNGNGKGAPDGNRKKSIKW